MSEVVTYSLSELPKIASFVLEKLGESNLITLSGPLGAGKTTLTQEIGRILGVDEEITSPTFILHRTYQTQNQKFKKLHHWDFYRLLESEFSLADLGFNELMEESDSLIIIEWPEKILPHLTSNSLEIILKRKNENEREIKIS